MRSLFSSFYHAWSGLKYVYSHERNMRLHVFSASCVFGLSILLGVQRVEVLMLTLAVAGVFIAEVVNTVVERFMDFLIDEYSFAAKIVKDVAAAGVLLSSLFAVIIGFIAFYPSFFDMGERIKGCFAQRLPLFICYCLFCLLPAFLGLFLAHGETA